MKITFTSNVDVVSEKMRKTITDGLPFAAVVALTRVAKEAQAAEVAEMQRVFDRPTPATQRSVFVLPATKSRLSAVVGIKDRFSSGIPADVWLGPEIEGKPRRRKPFEKALIAAGVMPEGMYAVPSRRVPLDQYGNVRGGFVNQLLSALGAAETTAGYQANRTGRSRARKPLRAEFFVGNPKNRTQAARSAKSGEQGIWQRVGARGLRPVFLFVKQPAYRQRFDFYGVGRRVVASRFEPVMREAMRQYRPR